MTSIIVGRKGEQPFPITDNTVSGQHILVTMKDNGNVLVEDVGSKNGTFYNGKKIIKQEISIDETVTLGQFVLNLSEVFKQNDKFEKLKDIWERYSKEKLAIQKKYFRKNFLRTMPAYILAVIGFVCNIIPGFDGFRIYVTVAGIILVAIIAMMTYKSVGQYPEQMDELNQKFKVDYVCPDCKQFLGTIPFEGLRNQRICPHCKSRWV